jgi:hypothetical protein
MDTFVKALALVKESIESLRWWALACALITSYLRFAPANLQPFVSQAYLAQDNRYELLGLTLLCSLAVLLVGWTSALTKHLANTALQKRLIKEERRRKVQAKWDVRRQRRAEARLERIKIGQQLRQLSAPERQLVRLASLRPSGILTIKSTDSLDVADVLVSKGVFRRIRSDHDKHGNIAGHVFVVQDWVLKHSPDIESDQE